MGADLENVEVGCWQCNKVAVAAAGTWSWVHVHACEAEGTLKGGSQRAGGVCKMLQLNCFLALSRQSLLEQQAGMINIVIQNHDMDRIQV